MKLKCYSMKILSSLAKTEVMLKRAGVSFKSHMAYSIIIPLSLKLA